MSAGRFRIRRATLDDVGQLTAMWESMQYPVEDLARRVTEFQVAASPEGEVAGAIGLQVLERQGRIHSEAFTDFSLADRLRPALWERLQSVAANLGLLRLWTQEQAPFWNRCGLNKADKETLELLPAPWRALPPEWKTLKLKEDLHEILTVDQQFALFMEAEKRRTQRTLQHGRILKLIATLIALALLGGVIIGAMVIIRNNPNLLHRPGH
jgi:N-acetylglutamate synthase-like GNAT family acetyltransferase